METSWNHHDCSRSYFSCKLKDDEDDSWWAGLIGGIVVIFWGVLTIILGYNYS